MAIQYPISVGGYGTRVLEAGEGDRHVLFVHGLSTRADRWARTLDPLAIAGYHAVAIDLPGHGLAEKRDDFAYSVPRLATFLAEFLDVMGISRTSVVGTSLGGHIAGYLACEHPTRVERLALVSALGVVPVSRENAEAIRTSVADTSKEGIARKLRNVFVKEAIVTRELVEEEWRINNSPGARAAFRKLGDYIVQRLNDDLVGERLQALQTSMPIVLIWGDTDRLVPLSTGQATAKVLTGAPLYVVRQTGHAPYLDAPEEFNRILIDKFLAAVH